MRVGFDYHNVLDTYPNLIVNLMDRHKAYGDTVYVISAIGPRRSGTIEPSVQMFTRSYDEVHEVVFRSASQSPVLKTIKALELGIKIFYDDRQDVCDEMNKQGILCFKVPRLDKRSDIEAEVK